MAYEDYYEDDLAAFEKALADASGHVSSLRKKMREAKRDYLHLNSFATARHELDLVILKLEACQGQVNAGYRIKDKAHAIHRKSREMRDKQKRAK